MQSTKQVFALRFVIGMLESPFAVGVITLMGSWYTPRGRSLTYHAHTTQIFNPNFPQNSQNVLQSSTRRATQQACLADISRRAYTKGSMATSVCRAGDGSSYSAELSRCQPLSGVCMQSPTVHIRREPDGCPGIPNSFTLIE